MPTARPLEPADVQRAFARLAVAFGDQRIEDAATRALLVREWSAALSGIEAGVLESVIGKVIRNQKFWPTISEVLEAAKAYDYRTTEEKFGPRHTPPIPRKNFCREGRTEVEEMAFRAAELLRMKTEQSLAFTPALDAFEENAGPLQKPASQAQWISPELEAIARKRGYWRGAA